MFSLNKGLMAFPVSRMAENYKSDFNGAYVYNISNDSIKLKSTISHNESEFASYLDNIKRIIYIGDYLYTFSENEMQVHSIDTNKKVNELLIN